MENTINTTPTSLRKKFNKGDFVKNSSFNGSTNSQKITFGIFEGIDLAPDFQYTKKFSLLLFYDSYKYCSKLDNGVGWGYAPVLDVASDEKPCEKTIDTLNEDVWWSLCTPCEKKNAIEILAQYGYEWNEELLALVDINTGEIVRKIFVPKLEYHGETIKPIGEGLKTKLKESIMSKRKVTSMATNSYTYTHEYSYNDENWD